MNLEGDDLVRVYVIRWNTVLHAKSTVVDISNTTSTSKFVEAVEDAILGSISKSLWIRMAMSSLDEMTVGKLFFNPLPLQLEKPVVDSRKWSRDSVALDGTGSIPLTVNLTSNSTGSSNYSPVSGGGNQAIAEISVTTQDGASTAIGAIDSALAYVQAERSNLGSIQNRLTHTIDNLSNIVTSTSAAQSRIRDTDYAKETSELARTQIIQQAATAMLAQANQQPQLVLQLLQ